MAELTGSTAAQMAAAPLARSGERKASTNPIMGLLGRPTFVQGDGKQYPRTSGWGANKKPHPDGGTNETVAFIVFRPFKGLDLPMEGRIYCERFIEGGKSKRVYSISLPFLKVERRDASGNRAVEQVKLELRDLYRAWLASDEATKDIPASKVSSDKWEESD
jgi:hypothetical protein